MSDDRYLSITSAAVILGVHPDTLRNWDKSGSFPPDRVDGHKNRWYLLSRILRRKSEMPSDLVSRGPATAPPAKTQDEHATSAPAAAVKDFDLRAELRAAFREARQDGKWTAVAAIGRLLANLEAPPKPEDDEIPPWELE